MPNWKFLLSQMWKRLWLRATLYAVLGVCVALLAAAFSRFVPAAVAKPFGGGTVNGLLNVLATSLLAVATFSIAAMLTAYTNVSQSATPRAATLITENQQAQSSLATFIGAFLYSVVAFSANGTGYYGSGGRAIVFFVTLAVLALVAVTLLRWLDQLLSLARVSHAIDQVEHAAAEAMQGPFGRSAPRRTEPPPGATDVTARTVGYVQNVDLEGLGKLAERNGLDIWIDAAPGAFAEPGRVVARVVGAADGPCLKAVALAFDIGAERSFSQDTRFGLIVLGQIASKALSPGINDPGTAIDVAAAAVRLLADWLTAEPEATPEPRPGVRIARPAFEDLVRDVFQPIAIDGASSLAVAMRLQRALAALAKIAGPDDRQAVRGFAAEALQRSDKALEFDFDRDRVHALACV